MKQKSFILGKNPTTWIFENVKDWKVLQYLIYYLVWTFLDAEYGDIVLYVAIYVLISYSLVNLHGVLKYHCTVI